MYLLSFIPTFLSKPHFQSLEDLLTKHISENMARRAEATSNLSQIAQIVTNLEHFEVACSELERSLTNIRWVYIKRSAVSVSQYRL